MKNLELSEIELCDLLFVLWSEILRLESRLDTLNPDECLYYEVESNLSRYRALRDRIRLL